MIKIEVFLKGNCWTENGISTYAKLPGGTRLATPADVIINDRPVEGKWVLIKNMLSDDYQAFRVHHRVHPAYLLAIINENRLFVKTL